MNTVDTIKFGEWLATLGVGGVLAAFIFMVYRKDIRQYTELWKTTTDQLTKVVIENTVSNTKLTTMIETQERNTIRKSDLELILSDIAIRKTRENDEK